MIEKGCLVFTTTHFSEFVLIGNVSGDIIVSAEGDGSVRTESEKDGEGKDTDLMAAIISLAVVDGVILILGIVLLVFFLRRRDGVRKVGSFAPVALLVALLAVTPSGGIAIVVVLGVVALAFLAADIFFIVELVREPSVTELEVEAEAVSAEDRTATGGDADGDKKL